MKKLNIVIVFHPQEDKVLMCLRQKRPYLGKYNFVGGKLLSDESGFDAAYRELYEETGISSDKIDLKFLMLTQYFEDDIELQVYYGTLKESVALLSEANPLIWIDLSEDFLDCDRFAGDGNIYHMLKMITSGQKNA